MLLIGASRGLGLALAREWAKAGRHVVATVRGSARTPLHDLADTLPEQIDIESVDITEPAQTTALHDRLAGRMFDLLFINAGVTNEPEGTVAETLTEEFTRVMVTNALSPLRVIEGLQDLVEPAGTIGVMSSGQGPDARLSVDESIPNVVRTLDALQGTPGLHYVDYLGRTVAW